MGKREYIQLELLFDDTQVEAKEDSCFLRAKLLKNKSNMQAFYIIMNVQLLKNHIFMNVRCK